MPSAPLRFPILVIGGWIGGRAAFLLPGLAGIGGGAAVTVTTLTLAPLVMDRVERPMLPAPTANVTVALDPPRSPQPGEIMIALDEPLVPAARAEWRLASYEVIPAPPPSVPRPAPPEPGFTDMPPARGSRWSGSAWLFARPDTGRAGLASGGQLGGSQAGVRLAYRLTDWGPGSLALAARVSSPLRSAKGAEAALGIDWHPTRNIPFRLSVERRVAIGHEGRNAWSAYAAGGFYRGGLPGGLEMDGYAQAGVVGARSRDLFADGAVRVGKPVALSGGKRLVVGAGAWGAAQPGANRLDIGPRASLSLPVAGSTVTGAVDWRIRVAGDAAPGSGAAFTLAADF